MKQNRVIYYLLRLLLLGDSFRFGLSLMIGVNNWSESPYPEPGMKLSNTLAWIGGSADGTGILILYIGLIILTWQIYFAGNCEEISSSTFQYRVPRKYLLWLSVLFLISVVGDILLATGDILSYIGANSALINRGQLGFDLIYLLMSTGGFVVARKLNSDFA